MEPFAELSSSLPKSKGAAEAMNNGVQHVRQRRRRRPHNIAAWVDSLFDNSSRSPRITTATATTTRDHGQEQRPGALQPITRFCRQQDSSRMPYAQPTHSFMDKRFIAVVQHLLQDVGASANHREQLFWDAYTWLAEYFGQPYLPLRHPPSNSLSRLSPSPLTQLALYRTTSYNRYKQDFEEEGVLGHGAFGRVVKARNRLDNCQYAIKIIPIMDEVESSLQEVQALAKLDHPRLVRYHYAWLQPYHNIWTPAIGRESNSDMDNGAVTETSSETGGTENSVSPRLPSASQRECTPSDESVVFQESKGEGEAESHIPNNQSLEQHSDSRHAVSQLQGSEKNAERAVLPYKPQAVLCRKMLFIQMGLCGESLKKWLDRRNESGSLVEGKNLEIFLEIVEGSCYMHRIGYIHRDIKPANIFFTLDGRHIQLGDFGLAKLNARSPAVLSTALHSGLTPTVQQQNTCCVGTPMYAAPEVQRGDYGPKSDIYSMGIILAELFSVFSTAHQKLDVIKKLKDERCIDHELNSRWPHIVEWILRLTEPDPASRPSSDELLKSSLFPRPQPPPPPLIPPNTTALNIPGPVYTNRPKVQEPGGPEIIQSNFNDIEILEVNKNKDAITVCTVEQCQSKDEEKALLKEGRSSLEGAPRPGNVTTSEYSSAEILKVIQIKTENSFTAHTIEKCLLKDEENAVLKEENNLLKKKVEELQLQVQRLGGCSYALQETEK